MASILYTRVSTNDQTTEAQRHELPGTFDKEFSDVGVSGTVVAANRHGFAQLLDYIREGDELHVAAIDRLGRDAIDVQQTVRELLNRGVTLHVGGLGAIGRGVGEVVVAVLAQIAQMERDRINERTRQGREVAKQLLASTGKTQHGATSIGRPSRVDLTAVRMWRNTQKASLSETARKFNVSVSTVKRACRG